MRGVRCYGVVPNSTVNDAMPRTVLEEARLHPAIRDAVLNYHADIVHNVQAAATSNPVLVVGMAQNPHCRKARRLLDAAGLPYHYLEYGSYLSLWKKRGALKMWSGWPTFPLVFVKGVLVGGAAELGKQLESGELKRTLGE
jgi:monothiol glutaredoxin